MGDPGDIDAGPAGNGTDRIGVLFIDDEPAVLDGIRRSLRRHRPRWRALFMDLPVEALLHIKNHGDEIDVVVSDISMPLVSGIQVMHAIKAAVPRIGLIAMSGQLDMRSLIGAQRYADRHLCKPVPVDQLCEAIERVYLEKRIRRPAPS